MSVPSATPSVRPGWPATLLAGLGLGLALYLLALKVFELPCLGGDCAAVLHSAYADLFGAPISLYAAACWCGLAGPRFCRFAAAAALVAGSVFYVGLQRFVLHGFCPSCCAHAVVAAFSVWLVNRPPRFIGMLLLALGVAFAGYQWAGQRALRQPIAPDARAALAAAPTFGWLEQEKNGSAGRILVLSLTCPKCLDLLAAMRDADWAAHPRGPRLVFLAADDDAYELTAAFIAAVGLHGGDARAFTTVLKPFLEQTDLVLGNPRGAAALLGGIHRIPVAAQHAATGILRRQQAALAAANVAATPLLLVPGTPGSLNFAVTDLWAPAPR